MSEKENLMARNFDDIPLINANHNEFATNVFCLMGQLIKGYEKYWTSTIFYYIQERKKDIKTRFNYCHRISP